MKENVNVTAWNGNGKWLVDVGTEIGIGTETEIEIEWTGIGNAEGLGVEIVKRGVVLAGMRHRILN